jgi:hypothetical protein
VRTDELVSLLANRPEVVDPRLPVRHLLMAALAGTALATLLTSQWLGLRSTLGHDLTAPLFWVKEAFCAALGAAGLAAVARLGRPGARAGWIGTGVAAPLAALWLLAGLMLLAADPSYRTDLILGQTAKVCSLRIGLISVPLFVAILAAMRGLAPTHLRLAGAASGFAAGSVGALVYSLHCPELEPPFVAIWYVLGILIPTAAGACAGPRALRW